MITIKTPFVIFADVKARFLTNSYDCIIKNKHKVVFCLCECLLQKRGVTSGESFGMIFLIGMVHGVPLELEAHE